MDNAAIDYEKLADMVADRVAKTPRNAKAIWDKSDCARYLKLGERHFKDRVASHPKFPTPITLPTTDGRFCNARWYADDIIIWAKKQKN